MRRAPPSRCGFRLVRDLEAVFTGQAIAVEPDPTRGARRRAPVGQGPAGPTGSGPKCGRSAGILAGPAWPP